MNSIQLPPPPTMTTFDHYPAQRSINADHGPSSKTKIKEIVLYKTEYCRNWTELGHCRYGTKCRYAHGVNELRKAPRHLLYKTQICRAYHEQGECPYGIRCTFIHDPQPTQTNQNSNNPPPTSLVSSPASTSSKTSCGSATVTYISHSAIKSGHGIMPTMIKYNDISYEYIYPYLPHSYSCYLV